MSSDLILHLDRSRTARPFDLGESLWEQEFLRIFELLDQHLEVVDKMERDRPHLALALYGNYGSGKTSLLKTLRKLVNASEGAPGRESVLGRERFKAESRALEEKRVYSLPILRPSAITEGESFLYAFLAAILREERLWARQPGAVDGAGESSRRLFTDVEKSLQEVTEHLQVLDESRESSHHDPIGVSVARLERHASDYQLKRALNDLIDRFSRSVSGGNRSLLLLPVDDTDLSQRVLFRTLDSIRRYLEHPRLVPICAFNGRLAEELLVTHFSKELRREGETRSEEWHRFENDIALQYLARMFPVRNRIRLGATTVRVQEASYQIEGRSDDGTEPREVARLLEEGSRVLFGFPEALLEPRVELALRPTVLRRQLQILDALVDARVEELFSGGADRAASSAGAQDEAARPNGEGEDAALTRRSKDWADAFEKATWSILDAHRDVLKEVDIHLEDLYGWSARSLREWILSKLVKLAPERRNLLLDRWLHRTEDRRGQVLSLLAANVFRPPMKKGEQIPGEEPLGVGDRESSEEEDWRLNSSRIHTWFLNLWLGFYLPQILLRSRRASGETVSDMPTVGWSMTGAPALAMWESIRNGDLFGPGMMFLDGSKIRDRVEGSGGSESEDEALGELQLAVNLWCFYGYEGDQPWCALSLWRVLALVGQLLRLVSPRGTEDRVTHREQKIEYLLRRHLAGAHQPGSLRPSEERSEEETSRTGQGYVPFPFFRAGGVGERERPDRPVGYTQASCDRLADSIGELAGELDEWLGTLEGGLDVVCDPLEPHRNPGRGGDGDGEVAEEVSASPEEAQEREGADGVDWLPEEKAAWRDCLVRRLHADALLGSFWPALQRVYTNPSKARGRLNAYRVVREWKTVLEGYWGSHSPVYRIVAECPLLQEKRFPELRNLTASPEFPIDFPEDEEAVDGDGESRGDADGDADGDEDGGDD